ncbi:outer membrane beta-barrel protein [Rapidithrix thailandica]|uniref:Outer membrane beta-barrel protein n=1 Tax=Rapidithrix thailandica TaxID=413964 RepID=A0AAW9RNS6_9BACT
MKKIAATLFGVLLISTMALAQSPIGKGGKQINFGIGLDGWGVPIYGGMDFGVHPDISLGFELSYRSYGRKYRTHKYNSSIFGVAARGNYHFNTVLDIPQEWDLYAGLNLGYYHWSTDNDYPWDDDSGVGLGLQLGGRYYFSDKWGINLEFAGGNAVSGAKFGLSVKI